MIALYGKLHYFWCNFKVKPEGNAAVGFASLFSSVFWSRELVQGADLSQPKEVELVVLYVSVEERLLAACSLSFARRLHAISSRWLYPGILITQAKDFSAPGILTTRTKDYMNHHWITYILAMIHHRKVFVYAVCYLNCVMFSSYDWHYMESYTCVVKL